MFFADKPDKAVNALSLLICHGISLDGVKCERMATHLYGSLPYDYAPLCDDCGDNL